MKQLGGFDEARLMPAQRPIFLFLGRGRRRRGRMARRRGHVPGIFDIRMVLGTV